jgi:hypothetical protein
MLLVTGPQDIDEFLALQVFPRVAIKNAASMRNQVFSSKLIMTLIESPQLSRVV